MNPLLGLLMLLSQAGAKPLTQADGRTVGSGDWWLIPMFLFGVVLVIVGLTVGVPLAVQKWLG